MIKSVARLITLSALSLFAACAPVQGVRMGYAPSGHMTVPVHVGSSGPFQFVLDTGADTTVVYQRLAKQLNLQAEGSLDLQGQTGQASLPRVTIPVLHFAGVTVGPFTSVILPDRSDGKPLDGILGVNVFGRDVLELDYPADAVRVHSRKWRPDPSLAGTLPVKATATEGGHLLLPVKVNGVLGTAWLDTGARKSVMNTAFARAAGIDATSSAFVDDGTILGATNEPMVARRGPAGRVRYGVIDRNDISMRVVDLPVFAAFELGDKPAMLLGQDLLQDLRVIIDYPKSQVWFARPRARLGSR